MATATETEYVLLRDLMRQVLEGRDFPVDEFVARYLGDWGSVSSDPWTGLPRIPKQLALRIRGEHSQQQAQAAGLRAGYGAYLDERNRERRAAGARAFELEFRARQNLGPRRDFRPPGVPLGPPVVSGPGERRYGSQLLSPEEREQERMARMYAQEAASEARARFDAKTPELDFQTWVKKHGKGS